MDDRESPRLAIEAAEDELIRAMLASDVDALDRLIDDRLIFIAPDGTTATKRDDLENYRSGAQVVRRAKRLELTVCVHDEMLAVTTAVVELALLFRGQEVEGKFRYLRTWKREQERWRIIAGAVTAA